MISRVAYIFCSDSNISVIFAFYANSQTIYYARQYTMIPCTIGKWQPTRPLEVTLVKGANVLHFALQDGSRGVTLKDFTLAPVK